MCDSIPIVGSLFKSVSKALSPDLPGLPRTADPSVAKAQAAEKASAEGLIRRRQIAAGGRQSTLLAGQKVAEEEQRKTLLGQ